MDLNTAYRISEHPGRYGDWHLLSAAAEELLAASRRPNGSELDVIRASRLINRAIVLRAGAKGA